VTLFAFKFNNYRYFVFEKFVVFLTYDLDPDGSALKFSKLDPDPISIKNWDPDPHKVIHMKSLQIRNTGSGISSEIKVLV
jgi:hypothetical protein